MLRAWVSGLWPGRDMGTGTASTRSVRRAPTSTHPPRCGRAPVGRARLPLERGCSVFCGLTGRGLVSREARSSPRPSFARGLTLASRGRLARFEHDCHLFGNWRRRGSGHILVAGSRRRARLSHHLGHSRCGAVAPPGAACGAVRAVGLSACRALWSQAPDGHAPRSAQAPPAQARPLGGCAR